MSMVKSSSDEIKEKMLAVGKKFADKLLEEKDPSLKTIKEYFTVAKGAFQLVLDVEKKKDVFIDPTRKFASSITEVTVRSDVYRNYIDFCLSAGLDPLPRNQLYKELVKLKFEVKRRNDNYYLRPPAAVVKAKMFSDDDLSDLAEKVTSAGSQE